LPHQATGKSINFLHSVCHNSVPIPGKGAIKKQLENETSPANLFSDPSDNKFHDILERCYRETSSLVLDILFKQYKLLDHVTAMRKYLLLGQGDLIRYLLELLDEELGRPAHQLFRHNLTGILESAIRATNSQVFIFFGTDAPKAFAPWQVFPSKAKTLRPLACSEPVQTLNYATIRLASESNYLFFFNPVLIAKLF
jgi:Gamma tubulin complex component C-terminal